VRTAGDPATIAGSVRAAMHDLDSGLPVGSLASMERVIADSPSIAMRRYPAYLIGAFATLALVLAMLGIYGLLAYVVAQRTREIGIRLALGAPRSNLLALVIADGLKLALIGVAVGTAASLAAGRLLSTLLFGVRPTDFAILLSVAIVLLTVSVLASYLPARRAASIEPMQALRTE
jgi:putative ABC transport system permease protein